jgi:hypothetical protein
MTHTTRSKQLDAPDDPAELFTHMVGLGITDGLPVIPPIKKYVQAMIDYVGLLPHEEIGPVPPDGGIATIEKLAINAVMAGCLPEYFPVVMAAMRAVTDPAFDLLGIQTTTNPVTPVLLINGPIRTRIGINCGRGCMGPGFRANATIGRALKLALLNIGSCPPGEVSKSIHGFPGRFTFCFGELEEESPWEPFHVEIGFRREQSTVSVFGGSGSLNMWIGFSTPEAVTHTIADGMRAYGTNGYLRGTGVPVVVMGPGHAKIYSKAGWSKQRIKQELFRLTPIPLTHIPDEPQISRPVYENLDRSRSINLCRRAEEIVILVAGGPEPYHLVYLPSFTHPDKMITKPIDVPQ